MINQEFMDIHEGNVPTNIAPRRDLQEPAFRKYEKYIAKACQGSFVIKPEGKPNTFICRFKDAILGYKRYKYESAFIPLGFDVSLLRAKELSDGRVYIENTAPVVKAVELKAEGPRAIIDAADDDKLFDFLANGNAYQKADGLLRVIRYNGDERKQRIIDLAKAFDWRERQMRWEKHGPGTVEMLCTFIPLSAP